MNKCCKEYIEIEKIKIEMLEKEANIIFKQIIIYLTILGSIIAFLIQNISIQIKLENVSNLLFILVLPLGIILGNFMYWLSNSIERLKEIKAEMQRINKRIEYAKLNTW